MLINIYPAPEKGKNILHGRLRESAVRERSAVRSMVPDSTEENFGG
jgi:hypothetical protein